MSYTPTEWKSGDVVTPEKLNKIEGVLGPLLVSYTRANNIDTLNASYDDIVTAMLNGQPVYLQENDGATLHKCYSAIFEEGSYAAYFIGGYFGAESSSAFLQRELFITTCTGGVLDASYNTIRAASDRGAECYVSFNNGETLTPIEGSEYSGGEYRIRLVNGITFVAMDPDVYMMRPLE